MLRGFASLGKWGRRIDANDSDAALTVNQRGSGVLLDLQAAGVSKFAVSNAGAITAVVGVTSTSDITTTTVLKFKDGGTNFMTFKKAADAAARNMTFPDVDDTVVTLAATQELDNKTLDTSVAKGTWTASGTWTIPAVTLGGTITGGGQIIDAIGDIKFSATAKGIYTASADGATAIFVARNAAAQTKTVLTVVGAATVANSYITAQVGGTWTLASGQTWTLPALTLGNVVKLLDACYFVGSPSYGCIFNNNADTFNNFIIYDSGNAYLRGKLGIGVLEASITAALHLKAGTASAATAPLKLTSGTLMTAAEAGAIEFLTDDFYVTITTGAARKKLLLGNGINFGPAAVASITVVNGQITAIS